MRCDSSSCDSGSLGILTSHLGFKSLPHEWRENGNLEEALERPLAQLQEDGDGKPSIFVHSHQKILECNIGTVTSFYMGKKYQKTLAGGNQGCFFLTRKHFSKIGSTQG